MQSQIKNGNKARIPADLTKNHFPIFTSHIHAIPLVGAAFHSVRVSASFVMSDNPGCIANAHAACDMHETPAYPPSEKIEKR